MAWVRSDSHDKTTQADGEASASATLSATASAELWLAVEQTNVDAALLYERLGFESDDAPEDTRRRGHTVLHKAVQVAEFPTVRLEWGLFRNVRTSGARRAGSTCWPRSRPRSP